MDIRFIVDINAGKLAKWLRIMGYNALLFRDKDDGDMVRIALKEKRTILTKDTGILKRRLITSGTLKAILVEGEDPELQIQQIVNELGLDYHYSPFSLCLECNERLLEKSRDEVQGIVPPHVYKTFKYYMQCPVCRRIYWRGTHWEAMQEKLDEFSANKRPYGPESNSK
jgi:uncharacterized protein with PIN domain